MKISDHLKDLYEYNHKTNQRLITYLESLDVLPDKTMSLLSHICNAHQIWNARITEDITRSVWQLNSLEENRKLDQENYTTSISILEYFSLSAVISYTNSKGEGYSNTLREIMVHVVNHSNYHRAQIATDLKQHGIEPLATDYIFYKRLSI